MDEPTPTRERILTAAEELLRRHGPAKTTVADVARALGMSHANVYRHFASKAELRDLVAERWLHSVTEPLDAIAASAQPAGERLTAWLATLAEVKRRKVHDDPELFANYHALAEQARGVIGAHVARLEAQVARIVADGIAAGEFAVTDPEPDRGGHPGCHAAVPSPTPCARERRAGPRIRIAAGDLRFSWPGCAPAAPRRREHTGQATSHRELCLWQMPQARRM